MHLLGAVYYLCPAEQRVHPGVALGLVQIKGFGRLFQVKKTGLIFNKAVILRDKTCLSTLLQSNSTRIRLFYATGNFQQGRFT